VQLIPPIILSVVENLGQLLVLSGSFFKAGKRVVVSEWKSNWLKIFLAGGCCGLSFWLFLTVLKMGVPVSIVTPVREISIVISILFGTLFNSSQTKILKRKEKIMKSEPNWQPISNLPLIASMIDGQLETAQEQYDSLVETRSKPHMLDDDTVNRVIQSYTEQLEFAPIYKKQLEKWQKESGLSSVQRSELQRLHKQVSEWKQFVTDILDLADELKEGTIEKVLSKSDFELGLEVLKKWSDNK
jgi:uncharacterized membrane protein